MKQKTNRLHFSTRTLAMVLSIVMLIGSIATGSMLNTFAAYLKDAAANSDAVSQAASEGSDIAKSAIPSDDTAAQADKTEDKPDLSGFEENEIVRGVKDDFAAVSANADLASTGTDYYFHLSSGGGSNDSEYTIHLDNANSAQYSVASGTNYYILVSTSSDSAFPPVISFASGANIDASNANTSSVGGQEVWHDGTAYYAARVSFQSAGTMYLSTNGTTLTISSNATNINGGSGSNAGTGASGMGTEVTDNDLLKILNGTDIMFYCRTYYSNSTHGLTNGNANNFKSGTDVGGENSGNDIRQFKIQIAKTDLSSYYWISNNRTGWKGKKNTAITTAVGGEFFNGKTNAGDADDYDLKNRNSGYVSESSITTAATTLNTDSFSFAETMIFSTVASAATSSYGADLKYRYYILDKSSNKYYHLDIDDVDASTSSQLSGVNLYDFPLGNYTLITLGNDGNINYILDEDDFTVTDVANPIPTNKANNAIIFNLKASAPRIHLWNTSAPTGSNPRTPTGNLSYNDGTTTRYLSYLNGITTNSGNTPGAIAYHDELNDANKYTGDITGGTHNDEEVYYFYSDSTPSKDVTGTWKAFSHIGTTLKVGDSTDAKTIGLSGSVTVTNHPEGTLVTSDDSGCDSAQYIYYVVRPNGTVNKVNSDFVTDNSYTFIPDEVGTYKIFCYVKDMWGYETQRSTNILNIIVKQDYNIITKTNDKNLGTLSVNPKKAYEGQTVTITVNENLGDLSTLTATNSNGEPVTITSNTFTMPAANVTVRGVFTEVSGSSNWYYNGYDDTPNEMTAGNGDLYAKQMSIGQVGGQEYSYYHVTNRADKQIFTLSFGNLSDTHTVYWQRPDGWDDKQGWDSDPQVQFLSSDGRKLKDWQWMSYKDSWDSKGVFQRSVPYGAKKVQFRTQKNYNNQWPYTQVVDLETSDNCFYPTGGSGQSFTVGHFHIDADGWDGNGNIGNSQEKFWEMDNTFVYQTTAQAEALDGAKGFEKHTATHGGSHDYIKPSSLGDSSGDYYVIVLYSGGDYDLDGDGTSTGTLSANKIIWLPKLPGATPEEEENTIDVYAKDGAAPINWDAKASGGASGLDGTAYNYAAIATTEFTRIDGVAPDPLDYTSYNVGNESSKYQLAKIIPGSTIQITTTIASDYKSRFYVRGFCVNGVTYYGDQNGVENYSRVNSIVDSDGEYTLTYTIPADQTAPVEITPIYYMTMTATEIGDVDMVTFYLQGFNEVIQNDRGWGNTPYVYPFYGNLNNVDNAFGVYPGQPMVYVDGTYSIDVPVTNLTINSDDSDYKTTAIKGITISNGYADYVHKVKIYNWSQGADNSDPDHMQTYDFDDFYKIYNEKTKVISGETKHPNTITFRMKNEDDEFYAQTHGGLAKNSQRIYDKDKDIADERTNIANGWEDLTNFFNEKVDLFNTALSGSQLTADPVYVVSTGYNANIAGDYGTAWMVYDEDGNLLTADSTNDRYAIPPSVLLMNYSNNDFTNKAQYPDANHSVSGAGNYTDSISSYKSIYQALLPYAGRPVKISYEKNTQDIRAKELGTGAHRMDGRWFYTFEDDTVQSNIEIEYYDSATGTYVKETGYTGTTGESTGVDNPCTAKFNVQGTGATSADLRESGQRRIRSDEYDFNVTGNTGWTFAGLYLKYDDTYHKISSGKLGRNHFLAEINATIVARFDPTNAGTLTINHTVLKSSVGKGTATVTATVKDASGDTQATYPASDTASSILIPDTCITNANSEWTIDVTLTGTGTLDDTLKEFGYDSFNTAKSIEKTETGKNTTTGTSTFSFKIGDLYSAGGKQITKVLNYTSSFNATPHYYEFTYNYPKRGSNTNDGHYTARGTFSSSDYEKYVTVDGATRTVSEAFIKNIAPHVSNFNQELSLYLDGSTIAQSAYDSTNKLHTATVTYASKTKDYRAVFALPYAYKNDTGDNDGAGNAYKKFTADRSGNHGYNAAGAGLLPVKTDAETLSPIVVSYENFFTSVSATDGNTQKDSSTPNHVNNAFITAPEKIWNPDTGVVEYFSYWQVYDYRDYKAGKELDEMAKVTEVYYVDFNYRAYGDYYIVPVYSENASESANLVFEDENNKSAKIMYLGDSRNQWNTPAQGTSASWDHAADIIYNDFAIAFNYEGKELITDADKSKFKVGMFIERVRYNEDSYAKGDSSVNDMNYYKNLYNSSEDANKAKIKQYLAGTLEGKLGFAGVNITDWTLDNTLNIKNRGEKYYYFTSQSGQTVEDHSIEFTNNSTVDDFVYRAYSYLIYEDIDTKEVILSDPAYFSMSYTANI